MKSQVSIFWTDKLVKEKLAQNRKYLLYNRVEVIPLVPVPIAGLGGGGLLRDIFDLDSWIMGSGGVLGNTLQKSRAAFWKMCKAELGEGEGGETAGGERALFLPCNYKNPRKKPFRSGETTLPKAVAPLTEKTEKELVETILSELNANFGLNLDTCPALERGAVTMDRSESNRRIFVIGGSHMCKTAIFLPKDTVCLAEPGFVATPTTSGRISQGLRNFLPGTGDTVVLDLLSNTAFVGADSAGMPTQPFKGGDGKYHILGSLTAALTSVVKKALQTAVGFIEAAKGSSFILVAPTPRYVTKKCCMNPDHIDNFEDPNYEKELMEGIDHHIQSLNSWATELGIDFYILDPVSSGDSLVDTLRGRTSTRGESLWCTEDPVHLTQSGYRDIAEAIRGLKDLIDGNDEHTDDGSEVSASTESSASKRARLDSVVTRPVEPPARRGNGNNRAYRVASWLQGRNAPAIRGSANRASYSWRGRGGNHRARASGPARRGGWRGPWAYRGRW